jgi:hypothetical protein
VLERDSHATTTLSIATTVTHTFDAIAVAMEGQAQDGAGWAQSGEADVVIVLDARDEDFDFPEAAQTVIGAMGRPAIGVHLRLLERPSAMLSPPHVWPLSRDHRTSLVEGDVILVHMVDLDAFVGPSAQGLGALTTVRTSKDEVLGYVVDVDDKSAHVSSRFMDDVLFGFQTIDATRDQIIEGVVAQYRRGAADGRFETSLRVDSLEELTEVLSKVEAGTATMPRLAELPRRAVGRPHGLAQDHARDRGTRCGASDVRRSSREDRPQPVGRPSGPSSRSAQNGCVFDAVRRRERPQAIRAGRASGARRCLPGTTKRQAQPQLGRLPAALTRGASSRPEKGTTTPTTGRVRHWVVPSSWTPGSPVIPGHLHPPATEDALQESLRSRNFCRAALLASHPGGRRFEPS